jgi:hypothetical protein
MLERRQKTSRRSCGSCSGSCCSDSATCWTIRRSSTKASRTYTGDCVSSMRTTSQSTSLAVCTSPFSRPIQPAGRCGPKAYDSKVPRLADSHDLNRIDPRGPVGGRQAGQDADVASVTAAPGRVIGSLASTSSIDARCRLGFALQFFVSFVCFVALALIVWPWPVRNGRRLYSPRSRSSQGPLRILAELRKIQPVARFTPKSS